MCATYIAQLVCMEERLAARGGILLYAHMVDSTLCQDAIMGVLIEACFLRPSKTTNICTPVYVK
jgi:hypothetical protein